MTTSRIKGLSIALLCLPALPAGGEELLLRGGRLIDPVSETVRMGSILIRGDRIAAVLDKPPAEFAGQVLDLGGRWVLPGLHDLHVHAYGNLAPTGVPELLGPEIVAERMLYAGVVGFLDLANFEDAILALRESTHASPSAADLYAAGAIVTCPGGHGTEYPNPAREVTTPEEARASIAELAAKGPDFVKMVYIPSNPRIPSIDRPTMAAIVDEAGRRGIRTIAHVDHWPDALEAVTAGVAAITHTSHRPPPAELIALMLDRGTAIIPTLAVQTELARIVERSELLEEPLLEAVAHADLRDLYRRPEGFRPEMDAWMRRQRERRAGYLAAVLAFAEAGVPVLTGTDSGNPGTFQGFSLHRELELLVEAGLSEWQALRAATVDSGAFLGRAVGLAAGAPATLVVLEASPLEDIRNTRSIAEVVHRGHLVDRRLPLRAPDLFDRAPDVEREEAEQPPPRTFSDSITVETRPPGDDVAAALELDWLEVLTTAGTQGDSLYAVQQLPGVGKIDDGAGLFVRGGDVAETATYLGRSFLAHPYRFETPTGGYFGSVGTLQLQGLSLAAGGYPARYGNALSAVLELDPLDRPEDARLSLNVGLGSAGVRLSRPWGASGGLRAGANRIETAALVALNGRDEDFASAPRSSGADLSLLFESERLGRLALSGFAQSSKVEPRLEDGSFDGFLASAGDNAQVAVEWTRSLGGCCEASVTLSSARFDGTLEAGVLRLEVRDDAEHVRFDVSGRRGVWLFRAGGVWERASHRSLGLLPEVGGDFGGLQGSLLWDSRQSHRRFGSYFELERRFGALEANLGARADRYRLPAATSFEPRLSLRYRLSGRHSVRLASGLYRQAPAPEYLATAFGGDGLELMRATHLVAGYYLGDEEDPIHFRAEAYSKRYRGLPLMDELLSFDSRGHGSARGLDLLLRLDRRPDWDLWASYGYLEARRLYTPWQDRGRFEPPRAPFAPDFALPHTLRLAGRRRLPAALDLALGLRLASGRPFTPVIASTTTERGIIPEYGAINSERLPSYARLDLSLSRPFALFGRGLAIAYLGVTDLLDRRNVFRFVYNDDFTERRPAGDSAGRSLYFGISLER